MEVKITPTVETFLLQIARERDTLFHKDNIKLLNATRKSGRVSKLAKTRLEILKNQLPFGIYVRPEQVVNHIKNVLDKNHKNSLVYSPLVIDYPELKCCKQMKYRSGNIITGRDKEMDDILLSFTKSSKRGVILIGEPGVGKTAIVRALNNRLIERNVPRQLNGCYILNMDIPYIFAKFKEDPIGTIIGTLERASENEKVILFIDEVHQLLGQKMNDIMKPYLTDKMRFIGSTTIDEYHAIVTNDRALERRFTLIPVDEPNLERTSAMVKNTKSIYEEHHKCTIKDNICDYAVVNGSRFLGNRKNPDKSLDILDLACSIMYEKEIHIMPSSLDSDDSDILAMLDRTKKEISNHKDVANDRILTEDYVNMAISSATGIPFGEIKNSLNYNQVVSNISSSVFDQDDQIKSLANIVNIFKHVKADRSRPVSVILLVGPAGCGKNITSKLLAKNLYGKNECFVDYDMTGLTSEFMITELKGAPPGYVGYQKSGKLVKQVRNNPQSVVYFRGINKSHETIRQYIIDSCRRGKLIDSAEREAPLNNTVIIYSVTLSDDEYEKVFNNKKKTMGFSKESDNTDTHNHDELKKIIGEELIKAADEMVIFNKLNNETLDKIFEANVDEYLEMYNVDIDRSVLKEKVLEEAKNGQDVINKIASEVPKFVFNQLKRSS